MSYLGYVARRAAFAIASVYVIITLAFLMGTVTIRADILNALANAQYTQNATPTELYRLERSLTSTFGLDRPLWDRLFQWWIDVPTLDWGYSSAFDKPVLAVLDGRVLTTLEYVIPGLVLGICFGILAGAWAALDRDGVFDCSARLLSYAVFGVPAFVLAAYGLYFGGYRIAVPGGVVLVLPVLDPKTIAALAVGLGLLAGQLRFARTATLEQTGESFVKMLRAKGATRLRLARHVLRNAAIPIVSLSITELLSVLVLNIYVLERALEVHGLGLLSLRAIGVVEGFQFFAVMSDPTLLVWSIVVVVFLGIGLSFLQDVLKGYLDPRIRAS